MTNERAGWADQLLAHARDSAEPRAEDSERNLASIEARLGIAPDAGAPVAGAARGSARSGGEDAASTAPRGRLLERARSSATAAAGGFDGALVKLGLVLAFGLSTGLVGYWMGRAETEPRRAASEPEASASEASTRASPGTAGGAHRREAIAQSPALSPDAASERQPPSPAPGAARDIVASSRAAAAPPRRSRSDGRARPSARAAAPPRGLRDAVPAHAGDTPAFQLGEALELLRRAEAALRRGDGLEARLWLSDLDRRAPRALLVEERLVTETLASCALGEVDAARGALRELVSSNQHSMYRARLESSCVADQLSGR